MRKILSIIICGAVMLVSCRKNTENIFSSEAQELTFNASIAENNGKTYLDGYHVLWDDNDNINVNGVVVSLVAGQHTRNGVFRGNVPGIGSSSSKSYIAGYPSDATTFNTSTNIMSVSVPTHQKYNADKPLSGQMPMFGYATGSGEDMTMVFNNVANILKLNLYGNGAKSSQLKDIIIHSGNVPVSGVVATCNSSGEIAYSTPSGAGSSHYIQIIFPTPLSLSTDVNNPTPVYVVIPQISVATTLTVKMFDVNGLCQTERIDVEASTFNSTNKIYNTNPKLFSATENTHEIPALFTVGAGKQVMFTNANMYWDGDSFEFESSQIARVTTWNANHVNHFYWQPQTRISNSYEGVAYNSTGASNNDVFFTNYQNNSMSDMPNPEFTIAGYTGKYRVLTKTEKDYLIGTRDNHSKLVFKCILTEQSNLKVLVVCPDGFSFSDAGIATEFTQIGAIIGDTFENNVDDETLSKLEAAGAVILPVSGYRSVQNIIASGSVGFYWLATANTDAVTRAFALSFGTCSGYAGYEDRQSAAMVRLISYYPTDANGSATPFGGGTW